MTGKTTQDQDDMFYGSCIAMHTLSTGSVIAGGYTGVPNMGPLNKVSVEIQEFYRTTVVRPALNIQYTQYNK